MTDEITELQSWLYEHPADFLGHIKLKKLIKEYGEALDREQEAGFRELGV
jgi:hypothetical protein